MKEVIDKATLAGIVVIASYNNDVQVHSYPAEYENVIGVKAHDKDLISFNDGIVYAPGKRVATTNIDGSYVYVDGNSIAAAYVAGFAALVKENYQNKGGDFDIDALYSVINNIGN